MKRTLKCITTDCGFSTETDYLRTPGLCGPCPTCGAMLVSTDLPAGEFLDPEGKAFLLNRLPWILSLPYRGMVDPADGEEFARGLKVFGRLLPRFVFFLLASDFLGDVAGTAGADGRLDMLKGLLLKSSSSDDYDNELLAAVDELAGLSREQAPGWVRRLSDLWARSLGAESRELRELAKAEAASDDERADRLRRVEQALAEMAFMTDCEFVMIDRVGHEPGPCTFRYGLMRGAPEISQSFSGTSSTRLPGGHVFVCESPGERLLDLHPFMFYQNCAGCDRPSLFVWSGASETGPRWECVSSKMLQPEAPHRLAGGPPTRQLRQRLEKPAEFRAHYAAPYIMLEGAPRRRALPLWKGQRLGGRYRIDGLLARGPVADLYAATDMQAGGAVCVKGWSVELLMSRDAMKRWLLISSVLVGLRHDKVRAVLDYGLSCGYAYQVLQRVEGWRVSETGPPAVSLADLKLPDFEPAKIEIFHQIAEGVNFLHESGFAHGQIKPSNILLSEAGEQFRLYLADVGFSVTDWPFRASLPYMAPEQVTELETVNQKTDLFSLGVLLYELLTGQVPYAQPLAIKTAVARIGGTVQPPSTLKPNVSPELEKIVLKLLTSDPRLRTDSVAVLLGEVENWQKSEGRERVDLRRILGAPAPSAATEFVSIGKAQEMLSASITELDQWVKDGRLNPTQREGKLMYRRAEIEAIRAEKKAHETQKIAVDQQIQEIRKEQGALAAEEEEAIAAEGTAGGNLLTAQQVMQTLRVRESELQEMRANETLTPVARDEQGHALYDAGAVFLLKRTPKVAAEATEGETLISYSDALRGLNIDTAKLDGLIAQGRLFAQRKGEEVFFHAEQFEKVKKELEEEVLMMTSKGAPMPGKPQLFAAESEEDSSLFDSRLFHVEPSDQKGETLEEAPGALSASDRTGVLEVDQTQGLMPGNLMTEQETCRELRLTAGQMDILVECGRLRRLTFKGKPHFLLESVIDLEAKLEDVIQVVSAQSRVRLRVVGGEPLKGRTIVLDMWQLAAGKEKVIGRLPAVDIPLIEDQNLSRRHSAIRYPARVETGPESRNAPNRKIVLQVRDMGSQNGTFIGEDLCAPGEWYDLSFDTLFRIGSTTFIVERDVMQSPARTESDAC